MKKILLLTTVIICAATLYGMNEPKPQRGLEDLSPEVQVMIIKAIQSYEEPEDIISALTAISNTSQQLRAVISDIFIELVHILAQKFNVPPGDIAQKFKTEFAKKYIELSNELMFNVRKTSHMKNVEIFNTITELIKQGADVNYYSQPSYITPLLQAVMNLNPDLVELLLKHGADPHIADEFYYGTPLDFIKKISKYQPDYKTKRIIQLLEQEMKR